MKHLKGIILLIVTVIIGSTFFKGDVKARSKDFFKEYSGKYSGNKEYSLRLPNKCKMTIYMEYNEEDDDLGSMIVMLYEDGEFDEGFDEILYSTGTYQKTITLNAGTYTLTIDSDASYYVSLSGEYYPELSSKNITMEEGKTKTLKVNGTSSKVDWSSSKESIATVSNKGVVKAKKAGKTVITAKCGEYTLKCNVTVKKKPASYKTIAKKMKTFAKKNKNYTFKTIDVGSKCRLYGEGVVVQAVDEAELYGLVVGSRPYIELEKKSNGKTEIRLRFEARMCELSLSRTSLYCGDIDMSTSNRKMRFTMKNTYNKNIFNYSNFLFEGRMKGYAQISSSSNPQKSDLKKFNKMLGQSSLSMKVKSTSGAYLKFKISDSNIRKNWKKLLKEYDLLLKEY